MELAAADHRPVEHIHDRAAQRLRPVQHRQDRPGDVQPARAAISLHRLAGAANIAKALRHHCRDTRRPLQLLKII